MYNDSKGNGFNSIIDDLEKIFDGQEVKEENFDDIFNRALSDKNDNSFVMVKPVMKNTDNKKTEDKAPEDEPRPERTGIRTSLPVYEKSVNEEVEDILNNLFKDEVVKKEITETVIDSAEENKEETQAVEETETVKEETVNPETETVKSVEEQTTVLEEAVPEETEIIEETAQEDKLIFEPEEEKTDAPVSDTENSEGSENEAVKEENEVIETAETEEEITDADEEAETVEEEVTGIVKPDKSGIVIFLILAALLLMVIGCICFKLLFSRTEVIETVLPTDDIVEDLPSRMDEELKNIWIENKKINSDYQGQIRFDSGIINEPFVQAKSTRMDNGRDYKFYTKDGSTVTETEGYSGNDVYIYTDWKTSEPINKIKGTGTSTYLDANNTLNDQLLIIYGFDWNSVFPGANSNFSHLRMLRGSEGYDNASSFQLVLENRILRYAVCAVFDVNLNDQRWIDIMTSHSIYYSDIEMIDEKKLYDTGVSMYDRDHYVLLVLNEYNESDSRFCVLAKQVSEDTFN